MSKKHVISIALAASLIFGQLSGAAFAAGQDGGLPAIAADDIVIIYTNDIHCGYTRVLDDDGGVTGIGYAGVADVVAEAEASSEYVTLLDAGDALQGDAIGTMSKGGYLVQIMNAVGYDVFVPGNHEFDYGMERMLNLLGAAPQSGTERLDAAVVSSNFIDLGENLASPADDETVFEPYVIISYGETEVAYVGVTTPESFTKSTPAYFQPKFLKILAHTL